MQLNFWAYEFLRKLECFRISRLEMVKIVFYKELISEAENNRKVVFITFIRYLRRKFSLDRNSKKALENLNFTSDNKTQTTFLV